MEKSYQQKVLTPIISNGVGYGVNIKKLNFSP
jgi:hypothetical protein